MLRTSRFGDLVNFFGRLPKQEYTTCKKDKVTSAHRMFGDSEQFLLKSHDPRDREQHGNPKNERKGDSERARFFANLFWQLVGQDADENDVIDSEYDL
jgi:hypothetical protein